MRHNVHFGVTNVVRRFGDFKIPAARSLAAGVIATVGVGGAASAALAVSSIGASPAQAATVSNMENSDWGNCNASAVQDAPKVLWNRIRQVALDTSAVPTSFWWTQAYRQDIVKIVCYESTYNYHAENGPQYGWYQMNPPLINSEGVSWNQYWSGSSAHHPGWYQTFAAVKYIYSRYGNPAAAWQHEADYGWY
jgi:hypothetical protein